MDIHYLKGPEIDQLKWNSCVHYANNGNVFGYMWYLNHIAKDWDALVEGDYESVFPLVWKKGFFNQMELYQPSLMREMGIYSVHILSKVRIQHFLDAIPETFKRVDIAVNEQNLPPAEAGFEVSEKTNYQLLLNPNYEELFDHFPKALIHQLQRAEDAGLALTSGLKPEVIADFFRQHTPRRRKLKQDFHALQRIMYNALHRGWGFASGVIDRTGKLYAVNFLIYSHGKVMSLAPVQSPEGQKAGALPYLFEGLIRSHAGRPLILDFNTESTNELALQFGASPRPFYQIHRNKQWWNALSF
ncbi:MAG: hypothetical protein KDD02_02815 [Phaeodactylibacter sp.]|nr:hypothetical protein [Phaeodactylibacter sp.]MCB9301936.1 hypothetical protein [Lewinellaceae bacterium]